MNKPIGKHLTREQKRALQRRRANAVGIAVIAALLTIGFLTGRLV